MTKKKVLVLGGSGMLGSMVVHLLSQDDGFAVTAATSSDANAAVFSRIYSCAEWRVFRYAAPTFPEAFRLLDGQDWIVNAIGITKPLIQEDDPASVEHAVRVNALLPHEIGRRARRMGVRVIQIATDCVYSGLKGRYTECDAHDALDVYGKTKSLGEAWESSLAHLRCSIIGPEPKDFKFLIEWFRRQPANASVNGFTNHKWNGITTLHFAKVCCAIMQHNLELPHLQHIIPSDTVTKAQMLREFATAYRRNDIQIRNVEAESVIDRTLNTVNEGCNRALWQAAGYPDPPSIPEMIAELAGYPFPYAAQA